MQEEEEEEEAAEAEPVPDLGLIDLETPKAAEVPFPPFTGNRGNSPLPFCSSAPPGLLPPGPRCNRTSLHLPKAAAVWGICRASTCLTPK